MTTNNTKDRLELAYVSPLSAAKYAASASFFLVIFLVLGAAAIWTLLSGLGVFEAVCAITAELALFTCAITTGTVVKFVAALGVLGGVGLTIVAVLAALAYNLTAELFGGFVVRLVKQRN